MGGTFYQVIESIEKSAFWGIVVILAIIFSVFAPPLAIIIDWNVQYIVIVLVVTNILFGLDILFKTYLYKFQYLISLEFLVDATAIISAYLEILILLQVYAGPRIANLRILRTFRLIGRLGKIVRIGKVIRLASIFQRYGAFKIKREKRPEMKFVVQVSSKIQNIMMVLVAYITLRYGNPPADYTAVQAAWFDILFITEIIVMMIILGGVTQYYIRKTVGYPINDLWIWLRDKLIAYDFLAGIFSTLENVSKKRGVTELTLFKLCFEDFFEKVDSAPDNLKKFLAGKAVPRGHD